ncbi:hypothetical protein SAMN05414139_01413 [Burkholderia sp. D7]|nr:hypothetical protein SAMN05414139_01413 [Burkholderia sp. D7]
MPAGAHGRLANRSGYDRCSRRLRDELSISHERTHVSVNTKQTSKVVATLASHTLHDPKASAIAKSLAASALSQSHTKNQTGAEMEHKAGQVLHSDKYSKDTKTLAGSVVAQANKERRAK